jgi:hypothetical protein
MIHIAASLRQRLFAFFLSVSFGQEEEAEEEQELRTTMGPCHKRNPRIVVHACLTPVVCVSTGADTCIFHDLDFNPQNDRQAEDRCHRLGQTRPVTIYKLVSAGSVDSCVDSRPCRAAVLCRAVLAVPSIIHQSGISQSSACLTCESVCLRPWLSVSVSVSVSVYVSVTLLWYHNRRKISEIAARKSAFADGTLCESGGATASGGGAGGGGGRGGGGESPTLGLKDVLSEALAGVLD